MSKRVMANLDLDEQDVDRIATAFCERDTRLFTEQHAIYHSEEDLIQSSKDTAMELESLLKDDLRK